MPSAPSRLGDPNNFVTESLAFLDAQVAFVSDCNSVGVYLNTVKFDPYSWGDLSAITGSAAVSISNFIATPPSIPSLSGAPLGDAIDSLLATVKAFVPDANAVGLWIDTLVDPAAPSIADPSRPIISSVSATPLRNDGQTAFDTKSAAFYGSASAFSQSLQGFADYVGTFSSGYEDWLSISTTHTDIDDWGFIV